MYTTLQSAIPEENKQYMHAVSQRVSLTRTVYSIHDLPNVCFCNIY